MDYGYDGGMNNYALNHQIMQQPKQVMPTTNFANQNHNHSTGYNHAH